MEATAHSDRGGPKIKLAKNYYQVLMFTDLYKKSAFIK